MKALLVFLLLVAMAYGLFNESQKNTALQTQLDTSKQETADAHNEITRLKEQLAKAVAAAAATAPAGSTLTSPVAGGPAPAAPPKPPSQWMWDKTRATLLDAPAEPSSKVNTKSGGNSKQNHR